MQQSYLYLTFEQRLLQRTFSEQFEQTINAVIVDLVFNTQGTASSSYWATPIGDEGAISDKTNKKLVIEQVENLQRYRVNLGFPVCQGARISYFDGRVMINWVQTSLLEQYSLIEKISLVVRVVSTEREGDSDELSQGLSETAYIQCESLWSPSLSVTVLVRRNHESMQCLFDQLRAVKTNSAVMRVESYLWYKDEKGYLLFDAIFCPLEISVDDFEKLVGTESNG